MRTVTPTMPWPAAGTMASASSTTLACSSRPRRFSPASASSVPWQSPAASLARREPTLPRIMPTFRSGRACSSCAWRRRLAVPISAPAGMAPKGSPGSLCGASGPSTSASRASSRFRVQASTMPGGSSVSRSFRLCTAKSMRPSSSASWISLAKRPLPPISARRRSWMRSPEVAITCSSKALALRRTGQKCSTRSRKVRVCHSASGEPRVPTRSGSGRRACGFTGPPEATPLAGAPAVVACPAPARRSAGAMAQDRAKAPAGASGRTGWAKDMRAS